MSLTPDAVKQSDWVTQVTPGISIAATGARLRFNATYAPEVIYYARGQEDNQIFQRLNAIGTAELAKQLLFVDAGANVDQYNVSLQGPSHDKQRQYHRKPRHGRDLFCKPLSST